MIKLIIIDFDGVICDSNMVHINCWKYIFDIIGEIFSEEYYGYELQGLNKEIGIQKILDKYGHRDFDPAELLKIRDKKMDELYQDKRNFYLNKNIVDAIDYYKNKSVKIILYSASSRVKDILRMHQIYNKFDYIVDIKNQYSDKGEAINYINLCKKFNTSPRNCVGIEDSPIAIKAMKESGIYTIGIGKYTKEYCDMHFENVELFNKDKINI